MTTRIITAYCPNLGRLDQPSTVYSQHKQYFLSKNIECCLREKIREDISKFIKPCTNRNKQIILCINLNEDTTRKHGPLYQTLMHKKNLINALKHKHRTLPPPTTHNCRTKPIDAIMVSESCSNIMNDGWLEFKSNIGNHRIAYIDINTSILINKDKYEILLKKAWKSQINNEKCIARYIKTL